MERRCTMIDGYLVLKVLGVYTKTTSDPGPDTLLFMDREPVTWPPASRFGEDKPKLLFGVWLDAPPSIWAGLGQRR